MDAFHVALCGASHPHSRSHLKSLQLSDRVKSITLYDPDEHALNCLRNEMGEKVVSAYADLDRMLDSESVFAAVADLPTDLNEAMCHALIEGGVHILGEKPIARTSEELGRILTEADSRNVRIGVMYFNRYHPVSRDARRLVEAGLLGRVTSAEARVVTSQVKYRDPQHWLFSKDRSGGGILSWLGCHHLDLMNYVLAKRITEVSAVVATLSGESIDVDDVASLSFRFDGGAIGSLQAGYQLPASREGYIGPTYDTYVGFRGTLGRIFWDPTEKPPKLHVESIVDSWRAAPYRTYEYTLPDREGYGGEFGLEFFEDFLSAVSTGEDLPADGRDALHIAGVIEAAYRSSETGSRCPVEDRMEARR